MYDYKSESHDSIDFTRGSNFLPLRTPYFYHEGMTYSHCV